MLNAIRDEATIDNVVSNICMTVDELTFDGVDISFGNPGEKHEMNDNINLFMQRLSEQLHKIDKGLSISVFGNKAENDDILSYEVSLVSQEIVDAVDFVNVINYELREGVRTNNTNLKFTNPFESAKRIPNEKAVFGIPFFFNMSLMAYRNSTELETMKGNDIVMCGSEAYFASDDALLQKTR
ncbi:MAG: glycoside hydrolase family 18 protein [Clostridia bacterium]|nr:glycoside hydrolase family 18 protein [Clostridia bacterium]